MTSIAVEAFERFAQSELGQRFGLSDKRGIRFLCLSGVSGRHGSVTLMVFTNAQCVPSVVMKIARHAENLMRVRKRVDSALSQSIAQPIYLSEVRGHSVAITTFLPGRTLAGVLRGIAGFRKARYLTAGEEWITRLGLETKAATANQRLECLLHHLEGFLSSTHSHELRRKAQFSQRLIQDELKSIPAVVQHGDFHTGNLLIDCSGNITGVLDWADCQLDGLPGIDLVKLMNSFGIQARNLGRRMGKYCQRLGIRPQTCFALCFAHLVFGRNTKAHIRKQVATSGMDPLELRMCRIPL